MSKFIVVLSLIFGTIAYGQESFTFPAKLDRLPVNYLASMRIKDVSRRLSEEERHALCRLFVKSYIITKRRYDQDYLLNPQAPVYKLFAANFPGVQAREGEGGIFLGQIVRFLNTLPEYKTDIEQLLRESTGKMKKCAL